MNLFTGERKLGKFKHRRDAVTGDIVDIQTSSAFYMGVARELWGASKLYWNNGKLEKPIPNIPNNDTTNGEAPEMSSTSPLVDESTPV